MEIDDKRSNSQQEDTLTEHINKLRLYDDLTVQEVFKLYPEFVEEHKEEMWYLWEHGGLTEPYVFSEYLQQLKEEKRQWKKTSKKKNFDDQN